MLFAAKPIGDFRKLMYSSKVMAALEGYNHDICQQQITTLQMLSNPRFPWYVNSEVKMQTLTPLLTRELLYTAVTRAKKKVATALHHPNYCT